MKKRNFSAEFKRESAQLVVDQNYTVADAAKAMDVGLSTMTRWVKQLRDERQGNSPKNRKTRLSPRRDWLQRGSTLK